VNRPFIDAVDWSRPWLAPLLPAADPILKAPDWRAALNAGAASLGLCNHRGLPLRFVPQAELPPGTAYESFISATGCVPTRENLHDFFNALVWLTFPRIKVRLNALQAAAIGRTEGGTEAVGARRGKLRDAATIFDENAALLVTQDMALVDALRAHRWRDVFVERHTTFHRDCRVVLFGHALMEKLVQPYKAITAHAWPVRADGAFFALAATQQIDRLDALVADALDEGLATRFFTPLPVLGVPGWSAGQDEGFYADASVFRPRRRPQARG
jgi:hypothetical protein